MIRRYISSAIRPSLPRQVVYDKFLSSSWTVNRISRLILPSRPSIHQSQSFHSDLVKPVKQKHSHSIQTKIRTKDLYPTCQGCGTLFQHEDQTARGYYKEIIPKVSGQMSTKTKSFNKYNELIQGIDENSLKVLLNEKKTVFNVEEETENLSHRLGSEEKEEEEPSIDFDNIIIEDTPFKESVEQKNTESKEESLENEKMEGSTDLNEKKQEIVDQLRLTTENSDRLVVLKEEYTKRDHINSGLCTICREVKGGKYLPLLGDRPSDEEVLKNIPKNAAIVHVISGADFPASVNPKINKLANGRDIIYVVTKADMIIKEKDKVKERALPYVKDEMKRLFGVDPKKVYLVSAMRTWYINDLFHNLPELFYLVGYPNVGKTKLAHAIAQKDNNESHVPLQIQQRFYGSNDIPGMTHCEIAYPLRKIRMVDLPPIGQENDAIWNVLKDEKVLDVARGKNFARRSICISVDRQVLSKPGQTLSLGGLVFLESPPNSKTRFIIWAPMQNYETVVNKFSSYEKAVDRAAKQLDHHQDWFFTKPYDPEDPPVEMVPEKIMELPVKAGGIDLSVFGLGHIQIRANGSIPEEGHILNVYGLPGIKVVTKTPLIKYLQNNSDRNSLLSKPKKKSKRKKYDKKHLKKKQKAAEKENNLEK